MFFSIIIPLYNRPQEIDECPPQTRKEGWFLLDEFLRGLTSPAQSGQRIFLDLNHGAAF